MAEGRVPPRDPRSVVASARPFLQGFDTLTRGGVPPTAFSPQVLAAVERVRRTGEFVPWDLFLDSLDQGRAHVGDDEAFTALFDGFEGDAPEMVAFHDPGIPIQELIQRVWDSYGAGSFPHVQNEHRRLPDGSLELRLSVPETFRDTSSFWLACVGVNRSRPRRYGLPPARVEKELTPHHLRLHIHLPTLQSVAAPDDRERTVAFSEVVRVMRQNLERALEARTPETREDRIAACAREWSLTPRQTEVLRCLCRGLSNQEISAELGCARKTVEIHVTELLRKAGLESRAQLLSRIAQAG